MSTLFGILFTIYNDPYHPRPSVCQPFVSFFFTFSIPKMVVYKWRRKVGKVWNGKYITSACKGSGVSNANCKYQGFKGMDNKIWIHFSLIFILKTLITPLVYNNYMRIEIFSHFSSLYFTASKAESLYHMNLGVRFVYSPIPLSVTNMHLPLGLLAQFNLLALPSSPSSLILLVV